MTDTYGPPRPITREQVEADYETKPIHLDDGTFACPICGETFPTANAVGPHKAAHARAVGLLGRGVKSGRSIARKRNGARDPATRVKCPRCSHSNVMRLGSIVKHLRNVHDIERRAALQIAAEIEVDGTTNKSVDRVEPEPTAKRRSTVTADEAAVAVILGAAGVDNVPVTKLPEIADWFAHTRQLVSHLTPPNGD